METKTEQLPTTRFWFYPDSGFSLHHFGYAGVPLECLSHTHDEYNIILCLGGQLSYVVSGVRKGLEEGEFLVINPGEAHYGCYDSVLGSTGLTLHITVRAMQQLLQRMRLSLDLDHSSASFYEKTHDVRVLSLGQELLRELDGCQSGYEMMTQALTVELLVHLLRSCLEPVIHVPRKNIPRQLPSWQMVRALEYMSANGKSSFDLTALCSFAGTSTTRFIQLFKNSMTDGLSPLAYHNQLTVTKAKRLLHREESSVKAVSYELGFQNESHFCKVFRSHTGMTPKAFQLSSLSRKS